MSDKLKFSNVNLFSTNMTGPIPDPPVFTSKFAKFTVPPYFAFEHAETQWLINMMRANSWDRIWRVAISNPDYFTQTYIQFPDCPDKGMGDPMFHKRAVLYLTPLGLAVYMNRHMLVRKMLEFRLDDGNALVTPNQQLYAANVFEKDPKSSDLHVIFPFCVLFRRESFECVRYLLSAGWNAHEGFVLPYRRSYRMFSFEYKDFLDYCIAQMSSKPNLRLPNLLLNMVIAFSDNFSLLEFEKVSCTYQKENFEDWISIPRRMLRFLLYFDKDLRLACQIVRCIKVLKKNLFFLGPCSSTFDIVYSKRKQIPVSSNRREMVIFDQDCCISLMLGIFYRAMGLRHNQTQEKLIDVIIDVLVHTQWIYHFLVVSPDILIDYFQNLIENVKPLKPYIIEIIKRTALMKIKTNIYHKNELSEINPKNTTKIEWEKAIDKFEFSYKDNLGHNAIEVNDQNTNNVIRVLKKVSINYNKNENSINIGTSSPYIYL